MGDASAYEREVTERAIPCAVGCLGATRSRMLSDRISCGFAYLCAGIRARVASLDDLGRRMERVYGRECSLHKHRDNL